MMSRQVFILAAMLASGFTHAAEEKVLNLYNWSDYFAPDTLAQFQKETGIKVRYDSYDSDETLQAKLLTGNSGYDLVWPSNDFMAKQIEAGAFRKLDKSRLSNLRNLDPALLKLMARSDPGNQYGVPYMWGTVGVGYDRKKVASILGKDMPANSLDLLFNPQIAKRLAAGHCALGLQDSASTILPLALHYAGRNVQNADSKDYDAVRNMLMKIRPAISLFATSANANELMEGELCVFAGYSGAINLAAQKNREVGKGRELVYSIPAIGTLMWYDSMAIPKTAPHPNNAHLFINFILRPDIVAHISNATRYANANLKAQPFVEPDLRQNPGVYPPESVRKSLFTLSTQSAESSRLENRLWTTFKTGK
ncbi:polyamine ABC transporter substrate-binding protein [uncultured Aquitalea sp.]|uniref:polyamine ABC transporter substrate-binding protein n=1 Tax=uncultured Aquitalea sp. TaxID=540272 RepID=UPI0025E140A7|nr:polyamine ABC transporter substrate-binding protein [uncultured Aquitalea sp.]